MMIFGTSIKKNSLKLALLSSAFAALLIFLVLERTGQSEIVFASSLNEASISASADPAKSRAAFNEAVKVFFSARCANCHPGGDAPTQGDANTVHSMEVKRGPDGRGVGELRCTTCHQEINLDGDNMPPGAPDWHMPGEKQKMPFQGITAAELCRNLKDPNQNGGLKTPKDAVKHLATDPKVLWAWAPGNGRSIPPMSHADFLKKMNEWVAGGAACPD